MGRQLKRGFSRGVPAGSEDKTHRRDDDHGEIYNDMKCPARKVSRASHKFGVTTGTTSSMRTPLRPARCANVIVHMRRPSCALFRKILRSAKSIRARVLNQKTLCAAMGRRHGAPSRRRRVPRVCPPAPWNSTTFLIDRHLSADASHNTADAGADHETPEDFDPEFDSAWDSIEDTL